MALSSQKNVEVHWWAGEYFIGAGFVLLHVLVIMHQMMVNMVQFMVLVVDRCALYGGNSKFRVYLICFFVFCS